MHGDLPNVVLDTNVLISAIVFGGRPRIILQMVLDFKIRAITSPILIGELVEILTKKFYFDGARIRHVEEMVNESFEIVYPIEELYVLNDLADNRVLEAAKQGSCTFIVTGDKELLELKEFLDIKIVTVKEFLDLR